MKFLVATRNLKKLIGLDRTLRAVGTDSVEFLSLSSVPGYPERPETGRTFMDNAYIKAFDGATHTDYACLADDSGLGVDKPNGMPSMLSARWSGIHGDDVTNYELLLAQMGDCPDECRMVFFRTVCALAVLGIKEVPSAFVNGGFPVALDEAGNLLLVIEGRWPGSILREPAGDNGFGYDPMFTPVVGEDNETEGALSATQTSAEDEDASSHRGCALRTLTPMLEILAEVEAKG